MIYLSNGYFYIVPRGQHYDSEVVTAYMILREQTFNQESGIRLLKTKVYSSTFKDKVKSIVFGGLPSCQGLVGRIIMSRGTNKIGIILEEALQKDTGLHSIYVLHSDYPHEIGGENKIIDRVTEVMPFEFQYQYKP